MSDTAMPTKRTPEPKTTDWRDLVTHDGVFCVDLRQRIVYWSPSAQRILGYSPEEVLGRPCYQVVGGRDSRNYKFCRKNCPVVANARRGRPTPDYDILCTLGTGEQRWLNISVIIPRKGKGTQEVLHLFRDVTHRRRTEELAQRASAAIREIFVEGSRDAVRDDETPHTPLPKLSRREMEVLRLLAAGVTTQQIAQTLAVQPVTARNHITRVLNKLGVENRLQAVVYASEHRIL